MTGGQQSDTVADVCWNELGGYYRIRNEALIAEIIRYVQDGHYCTVLGPPYCQKSDLLNDVKQRLQETSDEICVPLDLKILDDDDEEGFLREFAASFEHAVRVFSNLASPVLSETVTNEATLRRFLQCYPDAVRRDIVLLLDHLESVHIGPLSSLLRALRSLYTHPDRGAGYRLTVVTANALSTAGLAIGEGATSPFNIARVKLVEDLTHEHSRQLIVYLAGQKKVTVESAAIERCIEATGGDRYLIPKICDYCAETAKNHYSLVITHQQAEDAVRWFIDEEAVRHPPLQEIVHAVEADPTSLLNVLSILEREYVPRRELQLNLAADIDDLRLTGAVREEVVDGQRYYRMRNEIYKHYLRRHFRPERIVHVLTMAGKWKEAIHYLETLVTTDKGYRAVLLNTITDAIYSLQKESDTYIYLLQPIARAFRITSARFYRVEPDWSNLRLVEHLGLRGVETETIPMEDRNRPEVQAFDKQYYMVSRDSNDERVLHIPIMMESDRPLGVMTIEGFDTDPRSDEFLELMAYLKQVGRALGSLVDREKRLHQLETLQETGKAITESLDLEYVLRATVKGAIHAVPAAQKGSLFLWDAENRVLRIRAQLGFRNDIVDELQLGIEGDLPEGYAGWVFTERSPLLLDDVWLFPNTKWIDHPDVREEKSAIAVPLEAWGRMIGVLCLDNSSVKAAFQQRDLDLLSTFGAQAALAIQNASVYSELYNLGIQINRGNLSAEAIFRQTVSSITRVSGAEGANMLLLCDAEDPEVTVAQKPDLSVSDGLGNDYDENIHPRPNGLTYHVLKTKEPCAVSQPEQLPGINRLALERGTKAYLCLPMLIRDKIMGVLFVHQREVHEFSENETQMLSLFANQAALAIQNARQREELAMNEAVAWTGIVFSSLAHRITQNASAISYSVYGLRQSLQDQRNLLHKLRQIEDNVEQILEIPATVTNLSFYDHPETFEFDPWLRGEIERWCPPEYGIQKNYTAQSDGSNKVFADPVRLAVVIEILITNAVKAMTYSENRALNVCSKLQHRYITVEIENSGEIPDHVREKLFKGPIPKTHGQEGIGIGLLIARYTMRRYGGDLELVPNAQKGVTKFRLRLPLAEQG